jgi:hypothetical protein
MQLLRKRDREGFMVDAQSLLSDGFAEFDTAYRSMDLNGKKSLVATPVRCAIARQRTRDCPPSIRRLEML